ncbi:MAG: sugar phosphate isomerase [Acidobacteria bacterium 13_1_40CM_65_14]|nr:MAG: sugar phosphate isomerase [Acidobacteria bacterium 13_1_40CM_65_14]OLC82381.1 MAG: sugar phosphate isomerase [Acidobacteria bacterium 13_1_40CM_4_65_8]OLE83666.1 MAG: sugar phosphate isomerase [Acidobacteria bacterium 13_1_20CM_2_65_9]
MTSRRQFVTSLGVAAMGSALPLGRFANALAASSAISVLTDEISQDFGHACEVASREFGLGYVELRAMHGKNIMNWDANDIAEARKVLDRFKLRVSEMASPVFKTDWPGAPKSPYSPKKPEFGADFTYQQQDELLERAIDLAKTFNTPNIRIFDFWRLDDQKPYRKAIDDRIRDAAVKAGKKGVTLTLENELACNTATGAEAARLLNAVREHALMLNWDPGNATARGEKAYPDGYAKLPKDRIGHVHCKDVVEKPGGGTDWAAMGTGVVDWVGQFRALKKDGYTGPLSLETHWHGAATPEESTRQSMRGMKELLRKAESVGSL